MCRRYIADEDDFSEENMRQCGIIKRFVNDKLEDCIAVVSYTHLDVYKRQDKSYPGDNRLITPKSSHRRSGLAPRCRLIASWGCSRSQGLGCSPIKALRELGSERRETVRSLSGAGGGYLRGAVRSTRGPGWTDHWCICCRPTAWQSSQVRKG